MSTETSRQRFPLFINGERAEPSTGAYIDVTNPATGDIIAQVANGSSEDVDRAVAAARTAFDQGDWRKMAPQERSKILYKIANLIMANAQELALLEVAASGGTISRVMALDIPAVVDLFMTLAEEVKVFPFIENLPPRPLPEPVHCQVLKEPIGVCGLITAWNFPLMLAGMKLAPALAAGNTVVIKPATITPTSTVRLIEIIAEALPKGVVNVITGPGSKIGDALTGHPAVDKISFTGSTDVGRNVQKMAADTLKRVTLELGGKGAAIVMADADLERTAYGALFGIYLNSGQACESGSRLLVHESIHDALLDKLATLSAEMVLGNPMDPATAMGPMSTGSHGNNVLAYIDSAKEQGARIVCGGKRAEVAGCEGGFFVEPTVIADVTNDMKVAREEIFGPVLAVIKFSTTEEAIAIANDSDYGLSAGIWSEDVVQAQAIARELRAGSIWINDWHMMRTDAPFGGFKQSGYGREFSKYSLASYVETKAISTSFERSVRRKPLYRVVHKNLG
ncbi:MAG: aldehyde dehydrogenase family protein [Motiliproteus sp.]